MPSQRVRFDKHYDVSPEQVFALFADHERFGKLLGVPCRRIEDAPHGDDANGVGSVRRVGNGPTAFEETVLTCEAPNLIEYTVTRGSPIKNHHGRMAFSAGKNGGTQLTYTIEFDPRVPLTGALVVFALNQFIGRALDRVPQQV